MTEQSRPADGQWRAMVAADLPAVAQISDVVHGDYTESLATYTERLSLYPAGCTAFEQGGAVTGYCISHPWQGSQPPALNALIGALPAHADSYYLHDIALLPSERGSGAGKAALAQVERQARAEGLGVITLIAVNGADSYWAAHGFVPDGASPYGEGTVLMRRALAG